MLEAYVAIFIAFVSGSLLFSSWIAKVFLAKDIRNVADGNPGASNVLRSGPIGYGVLAMVLDFAKGFVPVLVFHRSMEHSMVLLTALVLAPVLGHAFSPFALGRGGKAVAVSFGVWSGLTLWEVPVVMGGLLVLATILKLKPDGWKVMAGMLGVLVYLVATGSPLSWYAAWLGNVAVFIYRHQKDLSSAPSLTAARKKGAENPWDGY